jgi:hypothetical protein
LGIFVLATGERTRGNACSGDEYERDFLWVDCLMQILLAFLQGQRLGEA